MHVFVIIGIQASRRIQPMSLMTKQSITERRVDSEIWGSPSSRQLLQLQRFPKILKNFETLLLILFFSACLGLLDFTNDC